MEIHKLQMTQYAQSDNGGDTRSELSIGSNKYSASEENGAEIQQYQGTRVHAPKQEDIGQWQNIRWVLNETDPSTPRKSLVSAGKNSVDSTSIMKHEWVHWEKWEEEGKKQKILSKTIRVREDPEI